MGTCQFTPPLALSTNVPSLWNTTVPLALIPRGAAPVSVQLPELLICPGFTTWKLFDPVAADSTTVPRLVNVVSRYRLRPLPGVRFRVAPLAIVRPPVPPSTAFRSEERRVGKEGRSRWSPDH